MTTETNTSVEESIVGILRQLGIERAHFASRNLGDWRGLAVNFPDWVASLTLICPLGFDSMALAPLADRLLVFNGSRGGSTETISRNMAELPAASMVTLDDYPYANNYADVGVERGRQLSEGMLDFMGSLEQPAGNIASRLRWRVRRHLLPCAGFGAAAGSVAVGGCAVPVGPGG